MADRNILRRIISGVLLAPIVVAVIYFSPLLFNLLVLFIAILMGLEWYSITVSNNHNQPIIWSLLGIIYIALPCISLFWLINLANGQNLILWLLLTIWVTDSAAYFCGRLIGGRKLFPKTSPKKTWAGLFGGIAGACVVGIFIAPYIISGHFGLLIVLNGFLAVLSQLGDFLESWVKRRFGVKDSGTLIPGHGGILDRVDGLTITAPLVALLVTFDKWHLFL